MSLMDLLLNGPSASDRLQQMMPFLESGGTPGGRVRSAGGDAGQWEDVARRMAERRYGYTDADFNKLDSIISRESNWDPNAVNAGSGAYGIPQILPSAHPNTHLENDPRGQIRWLLNYIDQRYGGIDSALAFKDANGWY